MAGIIDVARALRAPIDNAERIIPVFASTQITDAKPHVVLEFIQHAFKHQEQVRDADSKVFPARVVEVKRITRESNGRPLGQKALIVLETTDNHNKAQEEEITTHWVEFLGESDPATVRDTRLAWEMALSQSVEEDAKALLDKKVYVRKAFLPDQKTSKGGAPRYIADIIAAREDDDSNGGGRRGSQGSRGGRDDRSSRGRSRDAKTQDDIKAACRAARVTYNEDLDDLLEVKDWDGRAKDVAQEAAAAAGIEGKEVDEFVELFLDADGDNFERAVVALANW